MPNIPCIKITHKLKEGKDIEKPQQVRCDFNGERFLYNGVFNPRKSVKQAQMDGWSVLSALCDIILFYRPHCIVELGAGESTRILAEAAEKADVDFYSVDRMRHKLIPYSYKQQNVLGKTEDFMKSFDKIVSLVLIDANHSYEMAKKEFEFFFEKLVSGGVIFLHDTYPPHKAFLEETSCGDVYKLRQELEKRTDEMDCFTWPYTAKWMGLTMIIKKEKKRPRWGK